MQPKFLCLGEGDRKVYSLKLGDELKRILPIVAVSERISIASFNMLGDVALIEYCAEKLTSRLELIFKPSDVDYFVVPEVKGIPLAHEIAKKYRTEYIGYHEYIVLRKNKKLYMEGYAAFVFNSITTKEKQALYIESSDILKLENKKVVIIDDVFSSGSTLKAVLELMKVAAAKVVAACAVLIEGDFDAFKICPDIPVIYLGHLPIFEK